MRDLIGWECELDQRPGGRLERVAEVRQGVPYSQAEHAWRRLGFTLEEAAEALAVSPRTLHRRKAKHERLDPTESEKILRLARVGAAAIRTLGDEALARRWLREPIRALGGATPASLLDTDVGAQAVLDVLGRIEFGVYS